MGQATTGHITRRLCHRLEIAHEPFADEFKELGHRILEVDEYNPAMSGDCRAAARQWGVNCCAVEETGPRAVEEVLVVHHDALRKVDFLLHVDELAGARCELPAVPECVVAAKRAELTRRAAGAVGGLAEASDEEEGRGFDAESSCSGAPRSTSLGGGWGEASDESVCREQVIPFATLARRSAPGLQGAVLASQVLQPRGREPSLDEGEAVVTPQVPLHSRSQDFSLDEQSFSDVPDTLHPAIMPVPGRSCGANASSSSDAGI